MPAKSQAQRGLIFAKRNQYKTKKNTPKKWKWVWDDEYENKGKLPEKVGESKILDFQTFINEKLKNVDDLSIKELEEENDKYIKLQNSYKLTPSEERRWKKISKRLN